MLQLYNREERLQWDEVWKVRCIACKVNQFSDAWGNVKEEDVNEGQKFETKQIRRKKKH